MIGLTLQPNALGLELYHEDKFAALYRVNEELDPSESPKPCFAPIYTPSGKLITQYRPKDHLWHTGLYYGWTHVNDANLWGGPWYAPEEGKYIEYPGTHGRQQHESFEKINHRGESIRMVETLTWRDAKDEVMAEETRRVEFAALREASGMFWKIKSEITPRVETLTLGASRAAKYSGLELRMGPPFASAEHRTSEGAKGHQAVMGSQARWCAAAGATGGLVAMFDHPKNPRHPTRWFARANLLGAALLMDKDLAIHHGEILTLRYGFLVLDEDPGDEFIERQYRLFVG